MKDGTSKSELSISRVARCAAVRFAAGDNVQIDQIELRRSRTPLKAAGESGVETTSLLVEAIPNTQLLD